MGIASFGFAVGLLPEGLVPALFPAVARWSFLAAAVLVFLWWQFLETHRSEPSSVRNRANWLGGLSAALFVSAGIYATLTAPTIEEEMEAKVLEWVTREDPERRILDPPLEGTTFTYEFRAYPRTAPNSMQMMQTWLVKGQPIVVVALTDFDTEYARCLYLIATASPI